MWAVKDWTMIGNVLKSVGLPSLFFIVSCILRSPFDSCFIILARHSHVILVWCYLCIINFPLKKKTKTKHSCLFYIRSHLLLHVLFFFFFFLCSMQEFHYHTTMSRFVSRFPFINVTLTLSFIWYPFFILFPFVFFQHHLCDVNHGNVCHCLSTVFQYKSSTVDVRLEVVLNPILVHVWPVSCFLFFFYV